jgi:hypothetical protein
MVLPTWTAPKSVLDTKIGFCVAAAQVIAKSDKDRRIQYASLRGVPRQLMLFALFAVLIEHGGGMVELRLVPE